MPLDRYGVLAGTLVGHVRDTPDNQGNWYHVNLRVGAAGQEFKVAVDVDSKQSAVGVQWKVVAVTAAELGPAASTPAGYSDVAMAAGSGALDHTSATR